MRFLALLLGLLCAAGARAEDHWQVQGREAVRQARALQPVPGFAKNVVLFLGDGMGMSTVTAARILEGQRRGEPGEENQLAFERLPHVALAKTYNTNQQVPDSAGTMTAIVTGSKTRAGVLSVDESVPRGDAAAVEGHRLRTLLEEAEERGLATGVVTTARVTHATPAATYAHCPERGWEDDSRLPESARAIDFPDIARQLLEFPYGDGLEVALGGGRAAFLPLGTADPEYPQAQGMRRDGRNLTAEWTARGPRARYVWNEDAFAAIDPARTDALLGLFEPGHMRFETQRAKDGAGEPSLAEMTVKALAILSRNPRGYVLMVEGGRIDHGHHMGDAYLALTETIAFSDAVRAALERVDLADTLVVVTADHDHVLTMAGYPTRGNPILGKVTRNDVRGEPTGEFELDDAGLPYTTLGYQTGPGYRGGKRRDLSDVDTAAPDYLQEATVPLPAETHSGEDVPVFAGGPGSELFHGVQEQSYLYHAMVEALGWRQPPGAAPAAAPAAAPPAPAR
jgi:alkaline phosphatase